MYKKPYLGQIPPLLDIYVETFGYRADGYFVDIGAFDCRQWSNTFTLAQAGWRGLMVEPQPEQAEACKEHLARYPGVVIVEAAISNWDGDSMLRLAGSLSTIDQAQVDRYTDTEEFAPFFGESKFVPVKVISVAKLLRDYRVPANFDVLSLDVEGSEMAVLSGLDVDVYQPTLAIVEAHELWDYDHMNEFAGEINEYFHEAGYEKIYSDHINNIYRSGLWEP
jgi:FkbM family methyltransferase